MIETEIFVEGGVKSIDVSLVGQALLKAELVSPEKIAIKYKGSQNDIKTMLKSGFLDNRYTNGNIKNILVICDADSNCEKTFEELKEKLSNNPYSHNFNIPNNIGVINKSDSDKINVGIFLFPDCKNPGNIEIFCYDNLKSQNKNKEKINYIENYLDSLGNIDDFNKASINFSGKARFSIYIATHKSNYYSDGYEKFIASELDMSVYSFNDLISFIKEIEL